MSIKKKDERTPQELSDYIKKSNIRIIGIPEEEDGKKEVKNLFTKLIDEKLPNLWK